MTEQSGNPPAGGEPNPYAPPPVNVPPAAPVNVPPAAAPAPPVAPPSMDYAPPGAVPPPAAPGSFQQQWQQGSANVQKFDPKSLNTLDWGIIAAGVLTFIFSLTSYYKVSVKVAGIGGGSASASAWHGFFGWFGAVVALIAAGVLAANLIAKVSFPFPVRLAVLGAFALATVCTLLALFIVPGVDSAGASALGIKVDKGHGFGFWLCFILVIVGTGLAYKRFADEGGKLPSKH